MIRRRIVLAYWVVALGFFIPGAVYAYIDPATTTYIIQIITALVVTVGVSLSIFMYRFRMISARAKYGLYGLFRRKGAGAARRAEGQYAPRYEGEKEYILPDYAIPGASGPPTEDAMAAMGFESDSVRILQKGSRLNEPGDLSYFGRLKAGLPVILAICLCFILFGCMELVIQNPADMPFTLSVVLPTLLAATAAVFAALLLIVPIFRGRAYMIVVSVLTAFLIAGYIQGNYLNKGLGELTGDAIEWGLHKPLMAGSILLWVCVFAVVFLLQRFPGDRLHVINRILLFFIPALIIVIQGVGLLSLSSDAKGAGEWSTAMFWKQSSERLTIEGMHNPAFERNAIVFVLDRFDQIFADGVIAEDPGFFEALDGFTMFDDNISYAASTFPSVTGMLTGHKYRWDQSDADYFDYAWTNSEFIHSLKNRGVDIRLYMDYGYAYSDIEQLRGIAGNIMEGSVGIDKRIAIVKLLKLSAFKYAPMPGKPVLWLSPTEFGDALNIDDRTAPYITNDFAFYDNIISYGLTPSDNEAGFFYYHLQGPHGPLNMDENIGKVPISTPAKQTMGCMRIVYEYLRQLKELGLYRDATIIITGDHGTYTPQTITQPAHTALFVKPAGAMGTPLEYSHAPVCPDQMHGTIMEGLFGDTEGFGAGYLDFISGENIVREYDFRYFRYEIKGDGRNFANWRHVEDYSDEWEGRVN